MVNNMVDNQEIHNKEVIVTHKTSISRSAFHGQNGQCSQPPPNRTYSTGSD